MALSEKLRKVRGRSLDELRVRSAQELAAWRERHGWSDQVRVPTDRELLRQLDGPHAGACATDLAGWLAHFRERRAPGFFPGIADREGTVAELRRRCPWAADEILLNAQRIGAGRFDLLGFRDLSFGDPIDWHREPFLGVTTPRCHWSRIDYDDPRVAGDKKVLWELNRHQYLVTLGQAYWLTGDERYTQVFLEHLGGWMEANPPKQGIHWASSLEAAFRAISWLWSLVFFRASDRLTPPFFGSMLKYLCLHARHLETYLSTYFSPNTHLTGEALGLFYLGTLLPEFRAAGRWRATGAAILNAELRRQIRPDGVYWEQSSHYHRYTVDFYTHYLLLAQANAQSVAPELEERLQALLDHLMWITRPDGAMTLYGDEDGGKLMMLDARPPGDARPALSTGAVLFGRPEYKHVAGEIAAETVWLLGRTGARDYEAIAACPPALASRSFPEGGCHVMRDGWTPAASYLFLDTGPHGAMNGGHAHADALALELAALGRPLLVDPGTYVYTGMPEQRDHFRSTAAHNTLTVDEQPSSLPGGPWSWRHVARAATTARIQNPRFDYVEARHDGYERLESPVVHRRSVLFLRRDYGIVRDRVESDRFHRYRLHFQFVPGADPVLEVEGGCPVLRERPRDAPGLELFVLGAPGEWNRAMGGVSRCYGAREPAPAWSFTCGGRGALDLITLLLPRLPRAPRVRLRELPGPRGLAVEIVHEAGRDLFHVGDGSFASAGPIGTDFAWNWVRCAADGRTLVEAVLIGGRRFELEGRPLLDFREPVEFAVLSRHGEEIRVTTNGASDTLLLPRESPERVPVVHAPSAASGVGGA